MAVKNLTGKDALKLGSIPKKIADMFPKESRENFKRPAQKLNQNKPK